MVNLIANSVFGDSSSGLSALGINWSGFVIQLFTFLIVFLALKKWALKPILKILNNRRQLIEEGVKLGQEMQKERAELDKEVSEKLHQASEDADGIIASAQQEARAVVTDAQEKAQARSESILA